MSEIRAIHDAAKKFHWECFGPNFNGDHLLFDRVAETFNDDSIDSLAEVWYMGQARNKLFEINEFTSLVYDQRIKPTRDIASNNSFTRRLLEKIKNFKQELNTDAYGQGVKTIFDDLALKCDQMIGLLQARVDLGRTLTEESFSKVTSTILN